MTVEAQHKMITIMPDKLKRRVAAAAALRGESTSAFVREATLSKANEVFEEVGAVIPRDIGDVQSK